MSTKNDAILIRRDFLRVFGIGGLAAVAGFKGREGRAYASTLQTSQRATQADWSRFGFDLHNTRFNDRENIVGPTNVARLKLKWKFPAEGGFQNTPCVVGDRVYFGSFDANIYAVSARTGELLWKFDTETPAARRGASDMRSSPQYADGKLFFGNGHGDCSAFCLDAATGKVLWKKALDDNKGPNQAHISFSPTYYQGLVFFGTSSAKSQIFCLDAETGATRWKFKVVEATDIGGGAVWTSASIDEKHEIVYNVTGNAKTFMPPGPMLFVNCIVAHDMRSGRMIWHHQERPADPFDFDFGCHPMLFDATYPPGRGMRQCVAAGNKSGAIVALNRYTGELFWRAKFPTGPRGGGPRMSATAFGNNRVYLVAGAVGSAGSAASAAVALDAYTGDVQWWAPNEAGANAPIALANGVFYQGLLNGKVQALNADDGRLLWEYQMRGTHRGGTAVANGTVYTSSNAEDSSAGENAVYAFTVDGK